MKLSIVGLTFLFSIFCDARADLVILQKIEGGGQTGTVTTMRLKNSKLRVDIQSRAGLVSSVIDMDTGESMTLLHGQKLFTRLDPALTRERIEALRKKAGKAGDIENVKPEATGRKERVGEFETEVFAWEGANGSHTIWVTKDLPNYAKVKQQFDRLSKSPTAELQKGMAPDMSTLPGVVVKAELATNGKVFTSTVLSVKEEELNPALFEAPSDYRNSASLGKLVGNPLTTSGVSAQD